MAGLWQGGLCQIEWKDHENVRYGPPSYQPSASIGLDAVGCVCCIRGACSSSSRVLPFLVCPQMLHLNIVSVKLCPSGMCVEPTNQRTHWKMQNWCRCLRRRRGMLLRQWNNKHRQDPLTFWTEPAVSSCNDDETPGKETSGAACKRNGVVTDHVLCICHASHSALAHNSSKNTMSLIFLQWHVHCSETAISGTWGSRKKRVAL